MVRAYPMSVFEDHVLVRKACEKTHDHLLCVSDRAPAFVILGLKDAEPFLTEDDWARFKPPHAYTTPTVLTGSKLALRYYVALLCDYFNVPIMIRINAPERFICIAVSLAEYNRRFKASRPLTDQDVQKAKEKFNYTKGANPRDQMGKNV